MPLLEQAGHTVVAPDLPGHGDDKTPASEISLHSYVEHVCQILEKQSESVYLVGHSMGGIVISQAAEYQPDKIKTLVYLTAFLLQNGESLYHLAQGDTESLFLPNLIINEAQGSCTVREDAIQDIFYADCTDTDVAQAKSLLRPQSVAPLATPINITQEKFNQLPRVYIECLRDKAISPSLQKRMYTALPCQQVISMDTSHSPFFSAPEKLVEHLTGLHS